jgi:hypothetical protein
MRNGLLHVALLLERKRQTIVGGRGAGLISIAFSK